MFSTKALLMGASLVAYALAQTKIAFTSVPAVAVAGDSYNITWGGGDGSAVTITLRQGDPNDLNTIATLADGVTENFFLWKVSESLDPASDYALQITQGQDGINYSGLFSIAGGSGSSTISFTGTTTATASSNATARLTSTTDRTALPRNTTISSPTITHTTSLTPAATQHQSSDPFDFGSTSTTASFDFGGGTSTSSAPTTAATTSAPSGGAAQLGSSAALVMGVFAAVMCLS